jgi:hypothetical protein
MNLLLPKKVVGISILHIRLENYVRKERAPQMIRIHLFKAKDKEGGEGKSQLSGQWKVPMLGDQWKEKEKHLFTFSHFPPRNFT